MRNQIDVLLNIDNLDRAGRSTTISAIRKLSGMSHGRCTRLLEDMREKGLVYEMSRMYHGTIATKEWSVTPHADDVVTALKKAQIMNMPF